MFGLHKTKLSILFLYFVFDLVRCSQAWINQTAPPASNINTPSNSTISVNFNRAIQSSVNCISAIDRGSLYGFTKPDFV